MTNTGRILVVFACVAGVLVLLSSLGAIPPGTGSRLIIASMLLTWLAMLGRGFLFRSDDENRLPTVFQGSADGEWLPVLDNSADGLWIRRMSNTEKQSFLRRLKQSGSEDQAKAWADISIGWKGHCASGVNGWKGRRCKSGELLPYSPDAVYSCCLRNPDLFAHYAGRLQKTL